MVPSAGGVASYPRGARGLHLRGLLNLPITHSIPAAGGRKSRVSLSIHVYIWVVSTLCWAVINIMICVYFGFINIMALLLVYLKIKYYWSRVGQSVLQAWGISLELSPDRWLHEISPRYHQLGGCMKILWHLFSLGLLQKRHFLGNQDWLTGDRCAVCTSSMPSNTTQKQDFVVCKVGSGKQNYGYFWLK